jgi:hypothetical protein
MFEVSLFTDVYQAFEITISVTDLSHFIHCIVVVGWAEQRCPAFALTGARKITLRAPALM